MTITNSESLQELTTTELETKLEEIDGMLLEHQPDGEIVWLYAQYDDIAEIIESRG